MIVLKSDQSGVSEALAYYQSIRRNAPRAQYGLKYA